MKTRTLQILLLALLVLSPAAAKAAIVFTVNGTVSTAGLGWNLNDPVSFTWILAGNSPFSNDGSPTYAEWRQDSTSQPQMFSSVTGTGMTGTYTTPSLTPNSPWSFLDIYSYQNIFVFAGTDSEPLGLFSPNAAPVLYVSTGVTGPFSFFIPSPVPSPDPYFSNYYGTYSVTNVSDNFVYASSGIMEYTATSFTIGSYTPAAVPEPGTWAAAAMLAGGAAFMRWRKRAKVS